MTMAAIPLTSIQGLLQGVLWNAVTSLNQLGAASLAAATPAALAQKAETNSPTLKESPISRPENPAMLYRELGTTGERVSVIGMGGFHLAKDSSITAQDAIRLVRSASDHGITFFDNCWDYNDGISEVRMGQALKDGYRHKAFVMTKLDARTAKEYDKQLEQSMGRLDTDMIDLVQFHEILRFEDPDRIFADDGAIHAATAARAAGKIRYIGFTGHKDPQIHLRMFEVAAQHGFHFDTVQMPVNAMDAHFRSFTQHVIPVAQKVGTGILGMKTFGDAYTLRSGTIDPMEALHYGLSQPVSVLITGIDKPEVLTQALTLQVPSKLSLRSKRRPFLPRQRTRP
jgi:diketogulonate reductase-like aldo/keto reductase